MYVQNNTSIYLYILLYPSVCDIFKARLSNIGVSGTAGVFQYLNVEVRGFGPGNFKRFKLFNLHLWPGGQSTWSVGRPEKPRPEENPRAAPKTKGLDR